MKARWGDDGLHLFDRKSGLNVLLDEVSPTVALLSRAPRFVSFALTNLCDLHCPFCYAPKKPACLEFESVINWSRELDRNGCLGIGFGGGEPTLFPGFAALSKSISESTELSVSFTTHAHRLTSSLCEELTGVVHFIRVSMDGVGDTYERIRGRPFSSFVDQLNRVRDVSAFGINFVVNHATLNDLDAAVDLAEAVGARELLLLPEVRESGLASTIASELTRWINAYRGNIPLAISEIGATDDVPLADPFTNERGTRAYVHVSALGRVSRTSYDQNGSIQIDKDHGILDAIETYGGGVQ